MKRSLLLVAAVGAALKLVAYEASAQPHSGPAAATPPAPAANPEPIREESNRSAQQRRDSLREHNTLAGSTGLLQTRAAGSGAAGTFRLDLAWGWYAGGDYLCNQGTPCDGDVQSDDVNVFDTRLSLSATLLEFLEVFAGVQGRSASSSRAEPPQAHSAGDTNLGAKAFTPEPLAGPLTVGGLTEVLFYPGAGDLGLDLSATSLRVALLASADFRHPSGASAPLRLHLSAGYLLDNSGQIANSIEAGAETRVLRFERLAFGLNRVDRVEFAIGAEATLEGVRPFVEWSLGIPLNRQDHQCTSESRYPGDGCLAEASFSAFPSVLTFGLRAYPWFDGLQATAALQVGTTGQSEFIEELAPTLPYEVWLGVGYAFDATPPPAAPKVSVVEKIVVPPPDPPRMIHGVVRAQGTADAVVNAVIRPLGGGLTPTVSDAEGRFRYDVVTAGNYQFEVSAAGYADAQCGREVTDPPDPRPLVFDVECHLEALPLTSRLQGRVAASGDSAAVAGASVRLERSDGQSQTVTTDSSGAFTLDEVPPGRAEIVIEVEGYLPQVQAIELAARSAATVEVFIHKQPEIAKPPKKPVRSYRPPARKRAPARPRKPPMPF